MGEIVGALAGIAGSIIGGNAEEKAADKAAQSALTGFNYLTSGPGSTAANTFINNGTNASNAQTGTQGTIANLLGVGDGGADGTAANNAFANYQKSTGYQFQLDQGTQAINANAATRGLLQSGANAKALTGYGQNLASTTFNNYLGQLGGLNAAQGATASTGAGMLGTVGAAGSAGGAGAASAQLAGGQAAGNVFAGIGGSLNTLANQYLPGGTNYKG